MQEKDENMEPFINSMYGRRQEIVKSTSVDISSFPRDILEVPNWFLSLWTRLVAVDLRPLSHVRSIGQAFLLRNGALLEVDLSPLSNVTQLGSCFLGECFSLK